LSPETKRLSWIVGGVVIAVILIVLFVPGVAEYIEGTMLGWISGLAS
jgi:hypothetical protein